MALSGAAKGITYEEAMENFYILDADGLITIKRSTPLNDTVKSFARKTQEDVEGESLLETVRRVCVDVQTSAELQPTRANPHA
jgi:hypothetical protein